MTKLKLRLDDLRVDSFDTTRPAREKGTVLGQQDTLPNHCYPSYQPSCGVSCTGGTCDGETCPYTCAESCNGSCGPDTCYESCRVFNTCYGLLC
ncbi:MAG TPA: hypothetical protein VEQ60_19875 [Longimicrobium sp.]|nr:hypothetical protein [Longimicrobium sp.]